MLCVSWVIDLLIINLSKKMINKNTKIFASILSLSLLTVPFFVFAVSTTINNPLGGLNDIPTFVTSILGYVVKIGGVLAIFFFIWSGFLFVKAQGNQAELTKAREIFLNTCIGVAVLLGAQLIASIIVGTLNSLKN